LIIGRRFFSRRVTKVIMALAVLVLLATIADIVAFPAASAIVCPTCYGLERLDSNVFVERSMSAEARIRVAEVLTEARKRVSDFYGSLDSDPRILVCATEECYRRIGGGQPRGKSFSAIALFLSPRGTDATIASHELSHIELHRRLGLIHFLSGAIPAWFDEGVAVVVSDDPRYLASVGASDRCLVRSNEPLPSGMSEWSRRAGEDHQLYAKAACRVSEWISLKGRSAAVTKLVGQVSTGMSFAKAYAEPP
jgi:hypothetical protein